MRLYKLLFAATVLVIAGCSSSSSSGGGEDAKACITATNGATIALFRTFRNSCDYDVNVRGSSSNDSVFTVPANSSIEQTTFGSGFGACRAPSAPNNSSATEFTCS